MPLHWAFSRLRFPAAINIAIEDSFQSLSTTLTKLIRNTSLKYWLLDREGQNRTFVAVTMAIALVGILALHISSHRLRASHVSTAHSLAGREQIVTDGDLQAFITAQCDAGQDVSPPSTSAPSEIEQATFTPTATSSLLSKKPAPPGNRPRNADRRNSPFRFTAPKDYKTPASLFQPAPAQTPHPPLSGDLKKGHLTKFQVTESSFRPSEAPAASPSCGDRPHTSIRGNDSVPPVEDRYRAWLVGTSFSYIRDKWPTSFEVSVKSGDLLENGTPTKKFVDRMVLKKAGNKLPSPAS